MAQITGFEIDQEDIIQVLRQMADDPDLSLDFDDERVEGIYQALDHQRIESEALGVRGITTQTDVARDEIERQIRKEGMLDRFSLREVVGQGFCGEPADPEGRGALKDDLIVALEFLDNDYGNNVVDFEQLDKEKVDRLFQELDHEAINQASLQANNRDDQADNAREEIVSQIKAKELDKKMGLLMADPHADNDDEPNTLSP